MYSFFEVELNEIKNSVFDINEIVFKDKDSYFKWYREECELDDEVINEMLSEDLNKFDGDLFGFELCG